MGVDHYAALGVPSDADAKSIRRAYHALAAQFHPDRFFGRSLGSYRKTIEGIFMRLTAAYDALSQRDRRDAYDATLSPRPRRPSTRKPPGKTPTRRSVRAVRPSTASRRTPKPASATMPERPPPAPAPTPPAEEPPPASASRPEAPSSTGKIRSADLLMRMHADKQRRANQERVDVFVRAAKEALGRDDLVAAANHYRLAVQCSDDPELRAALEKVEGHARVFVRDKSLAEARAAEQAGRWGDAADRYVRAYGAESAAWIADRAANALRLQGTDLRRAAQLAEQAVLAEPNSAAWRVTLGEIYFDAGLSARAAGEAKRALALAPDDRRAGALAKLVAKGQRG